MTTMTLACERTLASGLCFAEGPRWHDGHLWCSDMHAHQVLRISEDGAMQPVFEVDNQPSGLGWLPDGSLLVVSMLDRRLLRWDGARLTQHADLSKLASWHCNDMVVDTKGRAWVGNFGFDLHGGGERSTAELICVQPDGSARVAADDLLFPNGTVITPDGKTLIVAETFAGCLTAFDIEADGKLSGRRLWARLPEGAVPDGICLDSGGGIWSASPSTSECIRQVEGGTVTHRVALEQGAYACMLGGSAGNGTAAGHWLVILTAPASEPDACRRDRSGKIEVCRAPFGGAGLP